MVVELGFDVFVGWEAVDVAGVEVEGEAVEAG